MLCSSQYAQQLILDSPVLVYFENWQVGFFWLGPTVRLRFEKQELPSRGVYAAYLCCATHQRKDIAMHGETSIQSPTHTSKVSCVSTQSLVKKPACMLPSHDPQQCLINFFLVILCSILSEGSLSASCMSVLDLELVWLCLVENLRQTSKSHPA